MIATIIVMSGGKEITGMAVQGAEKIAEKVGELAEKIARLRGSCYAQED